MFGCWSRILLLVLLLHRIGLAWFGLAWFGLVWLCQVALGLAWFIPLGLRLVDFGCVGNRVDNGVVFGECLGLTF